MDQQQVSRLGPTKWQGFWIVGVIVAVVFIINRFFVHRPLWDWIELLIVPAVIAAGGLWFNAQQREREQRIATQRAQDDASQAYLDQMSNMLIPSNDQPSLSDKKPPDNLRLVARARTLTVLPRLDGVRKRSVVQFLHEAGLIRKKRPILSIHGSDLREADLMGAQLYEADLSGVLLRGADLSEATLLEANLSRADLMGADLSKADLRGTNLSRADLSKADLRGADLSGISLVGSGPNRPILAMRRANLSGANLSGANLSGANLMGAEGLTKEQLTTARSVRRATMPNGQKYEDWLKSKGRGEDGENSGPS